MAGLQRLPMGLGKLADLAGRLRKVTKERLPGADTRKAFWEQIFSGPAADAAIKNDLDQAEQLALRQLQQSWAVHWLGAWYWSVRPRGC